MKRIVTSILLLTLLLTLTVVPGYAQTLNPTAEKVGESQLVEEVAFADQLKEISVTRDTSKPTQTWNLAGNPYYAQGDISYWTNTRYCFYPNSSGKIYVDGYFDWGPDWADHASKQMIIYCYKWNSNGTVSLVTSHVVKGTDGNGKLDSGSVVFSNLDANTKYYFQFEKTRDGVSADLYAKISHN